MSKIYVLIDKIITWKIKIHVKNKISLQDLSKLKPWLSPSDTPPLSQHHHSISDSSPFRKTIFRPIWVSLIFLLPMALCTPSCFSAYHLVFFHRDKSESSIRSSAVWKAVLCLNARPEKICRWNMVIVLSCEPSFLLLLHHF